MEAYFECGCCGQYHHVDYHGDCRDDSQRFNLEDLPDNVVILEVCPICGWDEERCVCETEFDGRAETNENLHGFHTPRGDWPDRPSQSEY